MYKQLHIFLMHILDCFFQQDKLLHNPKYRCTTLNTCINVPFSGVQLHFSKQRLTWANKTLSSLSYDALYWAKAHSGEHDILYCVLSTDVLSYVVYRCYSVRALGYMDVDVAPTCWLWYLVQTLAPAHCSDILMSALTHYLDVLIIVFFEFVLFNFTIFMNLDRVDQDWDRVDSGVGSCVYVALWWQPMHQFVVGKRYLLINNITSTLFS